MIPMSKWLAQNRSVEKMTWAPGLPEFIRGKLAVDGGWVEKDSATTLNTYRPPNPELGDATRATRWVEHWHKLYPDDAEHIIAWLACRVQRPEVKINHALVIGGAPKIGKDTLLEAVVWTLGEWNVRNVKLNQLVAKHNSFLQTLILRVNEARDVGEHGIIDRFRLHDHVKDMLAAPPNTLPVNEKYIPEFNIMNCLGVVITTNHRDAIYLPDDDRRHFVAFSECRSDEFPTEFWTAFWHWYEHENGFQHVAAYLSQYDLTGFNPKADPPKTEAFWAMVTADYGDEESELADAIDRLGWPNALTMDQLIAEAPALESLRAPKARRMTRRRLSWCGYVPVSNVDAKDRLWKVGDRRQIIYTRHILNIRQRQDAARVLVSGISG
jgi:hypothetical protein